MKRYFVALALALPLALAIPSPAHAMGGGSRIQISGVVSDFDTRYLYLDARSERYRITRSEVPEDTELKPGAFVGFEIPLKDLRVLPATAPATLPHKAPRERLPAQQ